MSDARLTALETLLAHQEKRIDDLNEMVTRQWDEIERLKYQVKTQHEQLVGLVATAKDAKSEIGLDPIEIAALNKPPHY